jgi:hypothetical protein
LADVVVFDDDAWVALAGACGAGTVCAYVAAVLAQMYASAASDVRTVLPTSAAFGVEVVREVIRDSPPLGVLMAQTAVNKGRRDGATIPWIYIGF